MKRVFIAVFFIIILWDDSRAQSSIPSYPQVAREFFSSYSHVREGENDRLFFAKKKQGWYVQIIDQLRPDSIKNEQLFWNLHENKYLPLNGYGPGLTPEELKTKIAENIRGNAGVFVYGFERCRYFGYDEWDDDMIKDFGGTIPKNDTLLEGLARAYSAYARRYLGHEWTGRPVDNDSLKKPLSKGLIPGKERIAQFIIYTDKSIDCYRLLVERNPGYMMLVGNTELKLINEQFHKYHQLNIYGYTKEANQVLTSVKNNRIYSEIGHTYLNTCPPNSIVITFADNDTYPLWYVQAKEGFRKDVTVLNYSLLGTVQYLNMLKKTNQVSFSTKIEFLQKLAYEYFYLLSEPGKPAEISVGLPTLINDLHEVKYPYITENDTLPSYNTKTIIFDVDIARLKKICPQSNLVPLMNFELADYLTFNDLIVMDILNNNLYKRPVCITSQLSLFKREYMQQEGSMYRILPLDESSPDTKTRIEIKKIENFLVKHNNPVTIPGAKAGEYEDILLGYHSGLFAELINNYIKLENMVKAKEWASRYVSHPFMKKLSPGFSNIQLTEALLKTGYPKEAKSCIEKLAQKMANNYRHYSAMEYFETKEDLLMSLQYFKSILGQKDITSDLLDKLIEDTREE